MANIIKHCRPLIENEIATGGYTRRFDLNWKDLFGVTIGTNTAQIFVIGTAKAGDQIIRAHLHVTTPFQDASDNAFNSDTVSFGDDDSATRFFSGVEVNANGSYVVDSEYNTSFIYTEDEDLYFTVNSMSGKDLTTIDTGQLYCEFEFLRNSDFLRELKGQF